MAKEISLSLWDVAGTTFLYDLDNAFDIQWQDVLNEPGIGKFTIPIVDLAAPFIKVGCMIRCQFQTVLEAYVWRVEEVVWQRTTSDEEYGQVVEVSGRGKGVRFSYSRVYPPKGVAEQKAIENRSISFASPEYDDSLWTKAVHVAAFGDLNAPWKGVLQDVVVAAPFAWPRNLPYTTFWIWPDLSTTQGTCYFRQTFALATQEEVTIVASGDNFWTLYLDGTALMGDSTLPTCWQEHRQWKGLLDPGTHTLAAVVDNISDSPAGFICAVYIEHDPICDNATPPNCTEVAPTVLIVSDYYWRCLAYPAIEPGFTPAFFMLQLLYEAQSRGQLLDVFATFSALKDSNNADWVVMPEVGANIGDSMLDVLDSLTSGKWVDWQLSPVEGFSPPAFTAVMQGTSVVLTWSHNALTGAPTNYQIYRAGWVEGPPRGSSYYWSQVAGNVTTVTDTAPMPGIVMTYILYPVVNGIRYGGVTTTVSVPPVVPTIATFIRDTVHPTYAKLSWFGGAGAGVNYDVEWMAPPGVPAFVRIATGILPGTTGNVPGTDFLWGTSYDGGSTRCWSGSSASVISMRVRTVSDTGVSAWVTVTTAQQFAPPAVVWFERALEGGVKSAYKQFGWTCPVPVAGFDVEMGWYHTQTPDGMGDFYFERIVTGMAPGTIANNPGGGRVWTGPAVGANDGGCWSPNLPTPPQVIQARVRSVGASGQVSAWYKNEGSGIE